MRIKFVLSALVIVLFSCKNKNDAITIDENFNGKYNLSLIDSIAIPVSESMNYGFGNYQYLKKGKNKYLLSGDTNLNGFAKINLKTKKVDTIISFRADGPNGIGTSSYGIQFYYQNSDSIFVFNRRTKKLYLTNNKSLIIQTYDLDKFNIGEPMLTHSSPAYYDNKLKQLVFTTYPVYPTSLGIPNSSKDPLFVTYNLAENVLKKSRLTYAVNIENKHPWYIVPSSIINQNKIVFLHPFENSLFMEDLVTNETSKVTFNIPEEIKYEILKYSPENLRQIHIKTTHNYHLRYDKDKDSYYVIISKGIPLIDENTGRLNVQENKSFYVVGLNADFQTISTTYFEENKYLVFNTFVGPKGLYLSKNNPLNPDFDENYYKYDIFTFEDN